MAENRVTGADGTYDPAPPPVQTDPLSGLVTGVNLPVQRRDEARVTEPAQPNPDDISAIRAIRAAVQAELDQEDEPPEPTAPEPSPRPASASAGLLAQWPAAVARRLRATKDRITARPAERKPAGMRSGMAVVLVIVLVTIVILYFVITSLADTFSQLFG